jgi:hypothetical protein
MDSGYIDYLISEGKLDDLYELYTKRQAFGKDTSDYIKNKVGHYFVTVVVPSCPYARSDGSVPSFLEFYERHLIKSFRCQVVDGFLLVPRGTCVPMDFDKFLTYFQRTRLKGVRSVPGVQNEKLLVRKYSTERAKEFCLTRRNNNLTFLPCLDSTERVSYHNDDSAIQNVSLGFFSSIETTFSTAKNDLEDYEGLLELYFDPKGIVSTCFVGKVGDLSWVKEFGNYDYFLLIDGITVWGDYVTRRGGVIFGFLNAEKGTAMTEDYGEEGESTETFEVDFGPVKEMDFGEMVEYLRRKVPEFF